MKVLRSLAVSVLMLCAGWGASAQAMDDDTKCAALGVVEPSTAAEVTIEAAGYIEDTMRALDRLHGRSGRSEIMPQMTEERRSRLVQSVISRCHSRQAVTVADTAIEAYQAERAAGPSVGSSPGPNGGARKLVGARYPGFAAHRQPAGGAAPKRGQNKL